MGLIFSGSGLFCSQTRFHNLLIHFAELIPWCFCSIYLWRCLFPEFRDWNSHPKHHLLQLSCNGLWSNINWINFHLKLSKWNGFFLLYPKKKWNIFPVLVRNNNLIWFVNWMWGCKNLLAAQYLVLVGCDSWNFCHSLKKNSTPCRIELE